MSENIYTEKYFDTVKGLTKIPEQKWKFYKIKPFLDKFIDLSKSSKQSIIDIGAGSSLILKFIGENYPNINFRKSILEVNEDAEGYISKHNPDANIIISDISKKTDIKRKEFDLSLLIDVVEHIENYKSALSETARISKYCIIKVPIEKTILLRAYNKITKGRYRKRMVDEIGHVNVWSKKEIVDTIEQNMGKIVKCKYANVPQYMLGKNLKRKNILNSLFYLFSTILYKISPDLNQKIFNDHLLILVKCK